MSDSLTIAPMPSERNEFDRSTNSQLVILFFIKRFVSSKAIFRVRCVFIFALSRSEWNEVWRVPIQPRSKRHFRLVGGIQRGTTISRKPLSTMKKSLEQRTVHLCRFEKKSRNHFYSNLYSTCVYIHTVAIAIQFIFYKSFRKKHLRKPHQTWIVGIP